MVDRVASLPSQSRSRSDSPLLVPSRSPSTEPRRNRNRRRIVVESSEPSPESYKAQRQAVCDTPESLSASQALPHSVTQSCSGSTPEVIHAVADSSPRFAQTVEPVQSGLAVRVSPRHIPSSQIWDYLSHSSAPYSSVQGEGTDAGIGESSLHTETQGVTHREHEYIVPDSQSLNQSSNSILSSAKRQSGTSGPLDTVHLVPASSYVSNPLETANGGSPASTLNQSRIPEPTSSVPLSLPIETSNSQRSPGIRSSGRTTKARSVRFSQQHDHSTLSQKKARSIDSLTKFSKSNRFSGQGDPAQTSLQDSLTSKKSGDSHRLIPASPTSGSNHSRPTSRQLQQPDSKLQRDNSIHQDTKFSGYGSQSSQSIVNGYQEESGYRRSDQKSEAVRPQHFDFQSLPQRSKPVRNPAPDSSSIRDFQTQVPITNSLSRTSVVKASGKRRKSKSRNQAHLGLNDSRNTSGSAAPFKQDVGPFTSSLRSQEPFASDRKSLAASQSHSSTSKFQTQISLGLGSPAASSPSTNHNLRSTKKSRFAVSSATRTSPQPLAESEGSAQSIEDTLRFRDSSILSERNPNSQPEKLLHSAQEREEICLPSIEAAEPEFEKLDHSIIHSLAISNSSPVQNMAENGITAVSPPVQMPTLHATTPTSERSSVPLRERLRNMRAQSAARLMAHNIEVSPSPLQPNVDILKAPQAPVEEDVSPPRASCRSPSMIPKPVPSKAVGDSRLEIQTIDDPISAGASQEAPLAPESTSQAESLTRFSQRDIAQALKSPKIGPMEFVVPLPAPARVRDQYVAIINSYQKVIQAIVNEEATDSSTIEKAQDFLENVENLSIHLDMVDSTTSTQQDVPPDAEAQWASNCSFKFQFLQYLIQYSRRDDAHVVIVAKEGRLMDLIETFLKGSSAAYNRPDTMSSSKGQLGDNLRISLVTSKEGDSTELLPAANLVIAFDSTFDATNKLILEVRSHLLNVGQLAPVVHLIIYSSPEHISRCLPSSLTEIERLRVMISCVTHTREEFGTISPEENIPEANAEEVAAFVKADAGSPWMLPPIRPVEIQGLEFEFQDTQPSTQIVRDDRPPAKAKRALVC